MRSSSNGQEYSVIAARIVLQLSVLIGTEHTVGRWIRTIDRCISARSVLFSASWRMRANQPSRSLGSIVGMRPCAASIKAGCVETITGSEKSRQADTTSPLTVGKRQHDREQCTALKTLFPVAFILGLPRGLKVNRCAIVSSANPGQDLALASDLE